MDEAARWRSIMPMDSSPRLPPAIASVLLTGLLAGCGGGGGGGGSTASTPPPPDPDATISGRVTFDDVPHFTSGANVNGLDYASVATLPVRDAVVELVAPVGGTVLATTRTDADGNYLTTVPRGTRVFVRVKAQVQRTGTPSWDFRVVDNTASGALYALDGSAFDADAASLVRDLHAGSGWDGSAYSGVRAAGPFAILDAAYRAREFILAVDPQAVFGALDFNWSPNNVPVNGDPAVGQIGTTFYDGTEIFVLGAADNDTDEYDQHVIIHEFGHYFEDRFARLDSIGGPHGPSDRLDLRLAFSEGWANAFAGMVMGDPVYRDSFGAGQAVGFAINVEANNLSAFNSGWYSEGSVQAILYDVFDPAPDGPDDVALGFTPMYEVLTTEYRDALALGSIFTFASALKVRNSALAPAIDVLLASQRIAVNDEFATGETNDANVPQVLPVYRDVVVGGGSEEACSVNNFGTGNKLGTRPLAQFTVPAGDFVIAAKGPAGTDPDMLLYQAGTTRSEWWGWSSVDGEETLSLPLSAGTYVLEVYECANASPAGFCSTAPGVFCFQVSVDPG